MAMESSRIRSFAGRQLETGFLNGSKKMSEFLVSAVVVVEGCNRCTLGAKHANLCLSPLYKCIHHFYDMRKKKTVIETVNSVYAL